MLVGVVADGAAVDGAVRVEVQAVRPLLARLAGAQHEQVLLRLAEGDLRHGGAVACVSVAKPNGVPGET